MGYASSFDSYQPIGKIVRIDPTTLTIFLTVVEEQSLARAAERHFMAASAVSKRISDLEDALSARLLDRHSGGVRPTAAGLELVEYAKGIVDLLQRLRADMSQYSEGTKGDVRVYANSTSIVGFLDQDLPAFLRRYPQVEVRLEEWSSPYIVRSLKDGLADVGLFWAETPHAGLDTAPYRSARLVIVVPERHALAGKTGVHFADTLDFDHVAFHEGSMIHRLSVQAAEALQRTIQTRLQVTSFDAMRTMVSAGVGVGIMTDFTVAAKHNRGGLCIVPLLDDWAGMDVILGYRDYAALPRAAQQFVDHLSTGRLPTG
ncbi:LysR family transcriptional regulator [Cupriavidus sp. P-10]|uniref:LysR family transcriptional regulator n=1 Tax=Cupriavidus sp. P-10 TaxID=2027911 RepID=UPI000E2ED092|nr:LysR family transcriptional regulator [Cupriavidus sp. P-10]BDB27287.1 LysR family transcriptional regulator [Cupriavidus sp. P-10]